MITPGQYTSDAVGQLNQVITDIDTAILYGERNRARRQYASEYDWSWSQRYGKLPDASADAATGLMAVAMPAAWNGRFMPRVSDEYGNPYVPVGYAALVSGNLNLAFMADVPGNRLLFQADPGQVAYQYSAQITDLPLSNAQDDVAEPFPHGEALTNLLIAYYWLATERASGKHQTFLDLYDAQLQADVARESGMSGYVPVSFPSLRP